MRNLSFISSWDSHLPSSNITEITFDLDENVVYLSSESNNLDGEVEVGLWKIDQSQGVDKPPFDPELITTFKSMASSNGPSTTQTIDLRFLPETRHVVAIMRGGDVVVLSAEDPDAPSEIEGTFDSGILAASWNPDESIVAIVTGEHKLLILTSTFDVLSEALLYTEKFGEDAPINVGWGSKQTQFHGSLGKAAAQVQPKIIVGTSPDDDNFPRISWRGDGAYFGVSSLSPRNETNSQPHRTLRIYDRQGVLQSTSEEVAGLEHTLAWRPSGNLIAGTQRFGFEGGGAGREGRHDVVFFERNGLRHGEFSLMVDQLRVKGKGTEFSRDRRWGYRVRELSWNSDSTVLAIWIEGDDGDIVQFWTSGNYHWYLKHEMAAPISHSQPGRFTTLTWHPELALHVTLTTSSHLIQRKYSWDTFISQSPPPNDSGAVAVLDGLNILLTPFRSQNVPPPMSSSELFVSPDFSLASSILPVPTPVYVSFAQNDALGVLWEHGWIEIWELKMKLLPGPGKIMEPSKIWSGTAGDVHDIRWRQLTLKSGQSSASFAYTITALGTATLSLKDHVALLEIKDGARTGFDIFQLPYRNCRLPNSGALGTFQGPDGGIFDYRQEGEILSPVGRFSELCVNSYQITVPRSGVPAQIGPEIFYVGLSKSGRLFVTQPDDQTRTIATTTISFIVASEFIIFTNTSHEAVFVPFASLPRLFLQEDGNLKELPTDWSIRKVERGSRIVVAVPSSMSLVLQMPRGNLETINPRPLVMEVVKQDLNAGNYRKAFFSCRKHRIDLNLIVDYDPETFLKNIPSFLDQIPEVDHLNLFLTLIGRAHNPPEFTNKFCDAFLEELDKRDIATYVNTILTAHVVKSPPDHEAGLALLLKIRETDPNIVEEAVKYIIFLVDANQLFDTALGMYDFSLVIMISQNSQKDPREYLPFLRDLRALETHYQHFRIDDHLKRYKKALRNLSLAGPERFDEAVAYVERHRLYDSALSIWKDTDKYGDILNSYGDWLFERREFTQAATVFVEAKKLNKAMISYEKALEWQELFDLAFVSGIQEDETISMGYRIAEELSTKRRYAEAGRVLLDYCSDIREALIALVQGNCFAEARRIISLNHKQGLMEDIVYPASLETLAQIKEDITEMQEQCRKQIARLRELRVKKVEEPEAFYGTEDNAALNNVDVMTDISTPATAFTRYTAAPTSASRSSRRTSRSKRKMERKMGSGRKGTVDEEEYLLRSACKLVERFFVTQGEMRSLLPHLFQFTENHRAEGRDLQLIAGAFETELLSAVDEIWARPSEEEGRSVKAQVQDSWSAGMAQQENRAINVLDKVPKPDTTKSSKAWRMILLEVK